MPDAAHSSGHGLTDSSDQQDMNEKDVEFLEQNWKVIPFPVLAERFSLTLIELTSLLRQKGITTDIQPFELQFIEDNIDRMPPSEIQGQLSLTNTQFSQILRKVLGKKQRKPLPEMSLPEAAKKTQWLIEEKLWLAVDDFLPRKITNYHFNDNGLYGCIRFAETTKKEDYLYRHFPAVAFLVCHTYPHKFKPFQFRHAKSCEYFKGRGGRKNLINAARWIIEKKMGYKPESLPIICRNKYFLRKNDLRFFGIGSHWFRQHFSSRVDFIAAVLNEYQVILANVRGNTKGLRQLLSEAGRPPVNCEVPDCYFDDEFGLDIHHIVPVSASKQIHIDINRAENLVSLCPNHHRLAGKFDWKVLNLKSPGQWLDGVLSLIRDQEKRSKPHTGTHRG